MPKLCRPKRSGLVSLDTEQNGLDQFHGARPFLVTLCNEAGENVWYEWPVDPLTREVQANRSDLIEIQQVIDRAEWLVGQNFKFDVRGLSLLFQDHGLSLRWPWEQTVDTLLAGHLLASNQPHDLTSMTLIYLRHDIQPLEDVVEKCTRDARTLAKKKFPEYRIAKQGLPEMPSAKTETPGNKAKGTYGSSPWKFDMWLPRHFVLRALEKLDFSFLPPDPRQPKVGKVGRCEVRIDRGTKWGNPFVIGKDGDRIQVIQKYVHYILGKESLIAALPELYGKTLGCHCGPQQLCHGDVLRALCHPWFTACQEYANGDSASTLSLYVRQKELLEQRGLWKIYQERLKLLPVVYDIESRGVTLSQGRTFEYRDQLAKTSASLHEGCLALADGEIESLPVNGVSNALRHVIFDKFELVSHKKTKKGNVSLDKYVLDEWIATLPKGKPLQFIQGLRGYRRRQSALGYIKSYEKYWQFLSREPDEDTRVLYPSLNPTATHTLRFNCENPNAQQFGKQGIAELLETGEETERSVRYILGPAPGREWWSCDGQNLELRLPSYEAGEGSMIDLFEHPDDPPYYGSNHLLICDILHPKLFEKCLSEKGEVDGRLFKKRYAATWYQWVKNGNFAVQYGAQQWSGTADRAYHVAGAQARIESHLKEIKKLSQRMIDFAGKRGYVETMPDKTVDPARGYPLWCGIGRYQGRISPTIPLSYHVQGSACWWMMKAMIRVNAYLRRLNREPKSRGYYIVMQIHDEMVFDFPKGNGPEPWKANLPIIREVQRLMALGGDDFGIPTPVSCEYHAENWGEGKSL